MVEGTDYSLSYTNNTNAGTAVVLISGLGNYGGGNIVTFEISRRPLRVSVNPGQGKERLAQDPVLTYSLGEAIILGNNITGKLEREAGENPGEYQILLGTLDAGSNYQIVFDTGVFTIVDTKAPELSSGDLSINKDPTTGQMTTEVNLVEGEQEIGKFAADESAVWSLEKVGDSDDTDAFGLIINSDGSARLRFRDASIPGIYVVNLCSSDRSGNKSCIQISALVKGVISIVIPTDWIEIAWGSSTTIPKVQEVVTTAGHQFTVAVDLEEKPLNRFKRGNYLLTGDLILPAFLDNGLNRKADIKVRVLPKPAPENILLSNNTFEGVKTSQEVAIGSLTVVDPVDNRHVLGLPHGMEDNRYFRVINDVLYWSSEDPAAGRTTFKIVVRVTDRDFNTLDRVFEITRLRKRVEDIEIYNTFTPEGDGINDNWGIPEVRYYRGARIQVFERSGKRVFYTEDADIRWDGTYNGKDMPVGSYYWVLEVRETGTVRKGIVNLLRK